MSDYEVTLLSNADGALDRSLVLDCLKARASKRLAHPAVDPLPYVFFSIRNGDSSEKIIFDHCR